MMHSWSIRFLFVMLSVLFCLHIVKSQNYRFIPLVNSNAKTTDQGSGLTAVMQCLLHFRDPSVDPVDPSTPRVNLRWYKNVQEQGVYEWNGTYDGKLEYGDDRFYRTDDPFYQRYFLRISNATRDDEGNYCCELYTDNGDRRHDCAILRYTYMSFDNFKIVCDSQDESKRNDIKVSASSPTQVKAKVTHFYPGSPGQLTISDSDDRYVPLANVTSSDFTQNTEDPTYYDAEVIYKVTEPGSYFWIFDLDLRYGGYVRGLRCSYVPASTTTTSLTSTSMTKPTPSTKRTTTTNPTTTTTNPITTTQTQTTSTTNTTTLSISSATETVASTLSVMAPDNLVDNSLAVIGASVGGVIALLLLIGVILLTVILVHIKRNKAHGGSTHPESAGSTHQQQVSVIQLESQGAGAGIQSLSIGGQKEEHQESTDTEAECHVYMEIIDSDNYQGLTDRPTTARQCMTISPFRPDIFEDLKTLRGIHLIYEQNGQSAYHCDVSSENKMITVRLPGNENIYVITLLVEDWTASSPLF